MNEKIKQLALDAGIGFTLWDDSGREMIDNYTPEERLAKFAELIVKETLQVARAGIEFGDGMEDAVYTYFGVEECRGWVCPKCGVDRTKDVCPQGHMAAVEGKCPMIGVAQ